MPVLWQNWHEEWLQYQKVTFDGVLKLIIVSEGVVDLSIRDDVYSAWKEWVKLLDNAKYEFAIRATGGDPTVAGQFSGDIYFLINGWRMVLDLSTVRVTGVLFSDDYETALVRPSDLAAIYPAQVSSLVTSVGTTAPTAVETASAVWTQAATGSTFTPGSTGYILEQQVAQVLLRMTAVGGSLSTVVFPSTASSVDSFYANSLVAIQSGTGAGQARRVNSYTGSTRTSTVIPDWTVAPDETSVITVQPWAGMDLAQAQVLWAVLTLDAEIPGSVGERIKRILGGTSMIPALL